jgi:hypothetical protein
VAAGLLIAYTCKLTRAHIWTGHFHFFAMMACSHKDKRNERSP